MAAPVSRFLVRWMRRLSVAVALGAVVLFVAGSLLIRPSPAIVGEAPNDLGAETVRFASLSGATLAAWSAPGACRCAAVVLLHGVRSNRGAMLGRARLLHAAGYSVLAVDQQAHGESTGDAVTFGFRERLDATSAVAEARRRFPGEAVGVVGVSMGGAAAALAGAALGADAVVLESVYADIIVATENRLRMRAGRFGGVLAPLLLAQLPLRTGVRARDLRPVDSIGRLGVPVLIVGGTEDRRATPADARALYDQASRPKELWWVPGAGHVDLLAAAPEAYRVRVLGFLGQTLGRSR